MKLIRILLSICVLLGSARLRASCAPPDTFSWVVAYCLASTETDDVVAAQPCIDREQQRTQGWPAERAKRYYERELRKQQPAGGALALSPYCPDDP